MPIDTNDFEYYVHFVEDWDGLIIDTNLDLEDDDDYIDYEEDIICD